MTLVFHQAALGDFCLILPLLRGLEGPTTFVGPWSRGRLATALIPGLRSFDIEMFEFSRLHSVEGPTTLSPAVDELFEQTKRIISFISNDGEPWVENVRRLSPKADVICLPTRPQAGSQLHIADMHHERLRQRGVELREATLEPAGDPDGPVVVHPGSGGIDKCWPRERFARLIETLLDNGRPVRVVYGEAEAERWPAAELERWREVFGAIGCGSLTALVEHLLGAAAFVGNDAGPTHLAAQLGLPTTALFGPTDPRVWAPRGPAVTVLAPPERTAMEWLSIDKVATSLGSA
jgi:hypothetical protein